MFIVDVLNNTVDLDNTCYIIQVTTDKRKYFIKFVISNHFSVKNEINDSENASTIIAMHLYIIHYIQSGVARVSGSLQSYDNRFTTDQL